MKQLKHIPFYSGLIVLVISIMVSTVQVGTKNRYTTTTTQAVQSKAALLMQFIPPDMVNIYLNSTKPIAGVDIFIEYDNQYIQILPSTLIAGPHIITSGVNIDDTRSAFRFSALTDGTDITDGMIAQFRFALLSPGEKKSTTFVLGQDAGESAVLEKTTLSNILGKPQKFVFTPE
jgi:hypothetical protein